MLDSLMFLFRMRCLHGAWPLVPLEHADLSDPDRGVIGLTPEYCGKRPPEQ